MAQPAVFLDRDNTLIANDGDLGDPARVRIITGVAGALAGLRDAGYRLVVVSNQGGVARGAFGEADVDAVNRRAAQLLDAEAGRSGLIDRFYFCPFHPEGTVERYRAEHPWRKPAPGMLLAAAQELDLDLTRSWLVGDQPRDIAAGRAAGCRTVLISTDRKAIREARATAVAADMGAAATLIAGAHMLFSHITAAIPADTKRLAIMCPSWVGDTIMATPVFRAARQALPAARIVAACRPGLEEILAGVPFVDETLVAQTKGLPGTWRMGALLRRAAPQAVLLLPNSFRAALIARLAGAPRRIGYRRSGRGALLTHALAAPPRRPPIPAIEYYARLGAFALGKPITDLHMQLAVTDGERAAATALLEGVGRPFALVCPGASKPAKRWPAERFARVAEALAARGLAVAVTGSPAERGVAAEVVAASRAPIANLVDRGGTLGALKGVIAEAALVVCNDTGPRHIAAALRRPVVSLFGPTDPRWTTLHCPSERTVVAEPFLPEGQVADDHPQFCDIARITVADVLAAIGSLLGDRASSAPAAPAAAPASTRPRRGAGP